MYVAEVVGTVGWRHFYGLEYTKLPFGVLRAMYVAQVMGASGWRQLYGLEYIKLRFGLQRAKNVVQVVGTLIMWRQIYGLG